MVAVNPKFMPSLEPVRGFVVQALQDRLEAAFTEVTDRSPILLDGDGQPVTVPLSLPNQVRQGTITDLQLNEAVPALVVMTSDLGVVDAAQQLGPGLWRGSVDVEYWDQHEDPDVLSAMLDRYGAAIWMVMVEQDPLGGWASIVPDSFRLLFSIPRGGSLNLRGANVAFDVEFRT